MLLIPPNTHNTLSPRDEAQRFVSTNPKSYPNTLINFVLEEIKKKMCGNIIINNTTENHLKNSTRRIFIALTVTVA
jgi:hypothetical protein